MQDNMTEQEEMSVLDSIELAVNEIIKSMGYNPEKVSESFKSAMRLGAIIGMVGVKASMLDIVNGLPGAIGSRHVKQVCEEGLNELEDIRVQVTNSFTEAIKEHLITSENPAQ